MQFAWDRRNVYEILVAKSERKRWLGRFRSRWKDNIIIIIIGGVGLSP
jgi:hypothetical protein